MRLARMGDGWRLALLGAVLTAAACTRLPPATDGLDFRARQARLDAVTRWDMRGRLAIDTGERAYQARFRWAQRDGDLRLTVRGMLGAGSFEVAGDAESLTLRARGEERVLDDPEYQLSAMYGWWMPVTSLGAWLKGQPDHGFEATTDFDNAGSLARLDQRSWRLDYREYQLSNGVLIPRRVDLKHDTLELRLTVDDWAPIEP